MSRSSTLLRPGLSTIPYSLLLIASSPYAKRGVLYANYAKYFGKDDAPVLVWQGTTEEMNSSLVGDPLIAEMYAEDHERALAEFGAQFRSDIVAFITREAVEDVVAHGVRELPPGDGITYAAFVRSQRWQRRQHDAGDRALRGERPGGAGLLCARSGRRSRLTAVVEEFAALLEELRHFQGDWRRLRRRMAAGAVCVARHHLRRLDPEQEPDLRRVPAGAERPACSLARSSAVDWPACARLSGARLAVAATRSIMLLARTTTSPMRSAASWSISSRIAGLRWLSLRTWRLLRISSRGGRRL